MNVLALIAAALKKSGPLFAVWVGLCFATALVFELYGLPLRGEALGGMVLCWGIVMLAVGGGIAVARRRRTGRAGAAPTGQSPGAGAAP